MVEREARQGSEGYTFPLMLIILAALAYGAGRLELTQSYRIKRDKEEELLFRGKEYMKAIRAFYAAAATEKRYPKSLPELVSDPRSKGRRFIRQLYNDPISGGAFNLIQAPDGTITGVVSASAGVPFRAVGFEKDLAETFEKAKTYADWRFDAKAKASANIAPGATAALAPPDANAALQGATPALPDGALPLPGGAPILPDSQPVLPPSLTGSRHE